MHFDWEGCISIKLLSKYVHQFVIIGSDNDLAPNRGANDDLVFWRICVLW